MVMKVWYLIFTNGRARSGPEPDGDGAAKNLECVCVQWGKKEENYNWETELSKLVTRLVILYRRWHAGIIVPDLDVCRL